MSENIVARSFKCLSVMLAWNKRLWYCQTLSWCKIHLSSERTAPFCNTDCWVWQLWRNIIKILWYKSQSTFFFFFDIWFWYSHFLVCSGLYSSGDFDVLCLTPGLQLKHHQSYISNSFTERCEWISDFFGKCTKQSQLLVLNTENYTFQHYVKV